MLIMRAVSLLLAGIITASSIQDWHPPIQEAPIASPEPVIEEIVEIVEPENPVVEVVPEPEPEPEPEPDTSFDLPLIREEIDLIALVTMGEAEGEPEEGKRLVIDVILNRVESPRFDNTVHGVIYAKNAFECMWNGRIDRCYVRDDIRRLVLEEIQSRTHSNIHYFRMNHYHNFGVPVMQVGNHYFSTY